MKFLALVTMILTIVSEAKSITHDNTNCIRLEQIAQKFLNNTNSVFETEVGLKFIEVGREMPPPKPGMERLPNLLDANAAHQNANGLEVIELPKPCKMSESTLPSVELWTLIIAHEFSHKLIDKNQPHCDEVFDSSKTIDVTNRELLAQLSNVHHANIDILSLKILASLGIDAQIAIQDFRSYLITHHRHKIGETAFLQFMKRITYMEEVWPTNFNYGTDLLGGEYFDGITEISRMIEKKFPNSRFLSDLRANLQQVQSSCYLFQARKIWESLGQWNSLVVHQ